MKLGSRISTCVFGVVLLALASSGLVLYSAWETNRLMTGITTVNLPSVRAAEEVEIALLEQARSSPRFFWTTVIASDWPISNDPEPRSNFGGTGPSRYPTRKRRASFWND